MRNLGITEKAIKNLLNGKVISAINFKEKDYEDSGEGINNERDQLRELRRIVKKYGGAVNRKITKNTYAAVYPYREREINGLVKKQNKGSFLYKRKLSSTIPKLTSKTTNRIIGRLSTKTANYLARRLGISLGIGVGATVAGVTGIGLAVTFLISLLFSEIIDQLGKGVYDLLDGNKRAVHKLRKYNIPIMHYYQFSNFIGLMILDIRAKRKKNNERNS